MTTSERLYELIQSLTKYEKSRVNLYIKTFAGKSKQQYLSDFKVFSSLKTYDKKNIKNRLSKNYPRKDISESLRNFYPFIVHAIMSVQQSKNDLLTDVKELEKIYMFISKGLMIQAYEEITKVKEKNIIKEQTGLFLALLEKEYKIIPFNSFSDDTHEEQLRVADEQIKLTENLTFLYKLKKLKTQMFSLGNTLGSPRTPEHLKSYQELYDNEILKVDQKTINKNLLKEFFIIKTTLYSVLNPKNVEVTLSILNEGIALVKQAFEKEQHVIPEFLLTRLELEVILLTNYNKEFFKKIEQFKEIGKHIDSLTLSALHQSKIHWAYLLYYINTEDIATGYEYISKNKEAILSKHNDKYSAQGYINFLFCARICFLNGQYEESMFYVNILIERKNKIRSSHHTPIHILYLLNHYKLGNTQFLPYAIRSLYRSLSKNSKLYAPEKAILSFLRKATNKLDIQEDLKILYINVKEYKNEALNIPFFVNGDYLLWIKKELEK